MATTQFLRPVEPRRAFEAILNQSQEAIASGHLAAGDRLPSKRELAERFQVRRTTARERYASWKLLVFGARVAELSKGRRCCKTLGLQQQGLTFHAVARSRHRRSLTSTLVGRGREQESGR